jgi:hypothetical protein
VERELAHEGPVPRDCGGERGVLRGVEAVQAGAKDRDRAPAALEGPSVRGGVDASCEAGHDRQPDGREVPRECSGKGDAEAGCGPGADDRDRPVTFPRDEGAADPQDGGRRVDTAQPRGVARFVAPDDAHAERLGSTCLCFRQAARLSGPEGFPGGSVEEVHVIARPLERLGERASGGELPGGTRRESR